MLSETSSGQKIAIADSIVDVIERLKMSSISMIADYIEMDEEDVLLRIEELISTGILEGKLSEDQTRFFKSDVKISDAPVIRSNNETVVLEQPDTRAGKYTVYLGIASIASGFVLRGISGIDITLSNMGASLVLLGIVMLAAGWLYVSRRQVSIA